MLFDWCGKNLIERELITPGRLNENAFIESFNSRLRDDRLNEHVFFDLGDAKEKIEGCRNTDNELHPYSSLGMRSPKEFVENWQKTLSA